MRNSVVGWLTGLGVATLLSACGGGSSSGGDGGGNGGGGLSPEQLGNAIHALDIAGAQGIVLTGDSPDTAAAGSAATRAASEGTSLEPHSVYKVTADGRLERVPVEDANGEELPRGSVRPVAVREAGENFVAMAFHVPCYIASTRGWQCGEESADTLLFLVHKESGLAYKSGPILTTNDADGLNIGLGPINYQYDWVDGAVEAAIDGNVFREDAQGNLYVYHSDRRVLDGDWLYRIDTGNLGQGNLEAATLPYLSGDDFKTFEVHPSGDFLAYAGTREDTGTAVRRLVNLATDEILNAGSIPGAEGNFQPRRTTLRGHDGELYVVGYRAPDEGTWEYRVFRLGLADGEPTFDEVDMAVEIDGDPNSGLTLGALNFEHERRIVSGRIFYYRGLANEPIEFDSQSMRVVFHDQATAALDSLFAVEISENYFWYRGMADGEDAIVRYDPAVRESILVSTDGLQLNRFQVLASDRVMFEGRRVSDNAEVRGEISLDGEIVITEEIDPFEPSYIYLVPIQPIDFVVIDGSPQEWPLDTRILFGTAGSGPEGDDLLYYSEQVGNGRYFGLVEFEGDIAPDTWTVIHLSQTHRVLVRDGAARFRDLTEDQSEPLSAVGGRFAVGEAVEFYLPLEALETQTPTAHRVERRPDEDGRPGEEVLDALE